MCDECTCIIQEPPTDGKVLLHTSVGDIHVELWSREAPKACRNFIQLCLEGYYDNTIFHRIVKGFVIQGGDPTGTGRGGMSAYGKPFEDEFDPRLRFNKRGLMAMANPGKDYNGSQFFFILRPAHHLQNKHTIFGKVVGNSIYNMFKLAEGVLDKDGRPEKPQKIIGTKVLSNPFSDIVLRTSLQTAEEGGECKKKIKNRKRGATKKQLKEQNEQQKLQLEAEKRKGTELVNEEEKKEETGMRNDRLMLKELLKEFLNSKNKKREEQVPKREPAAMKDASKPTVPRKKTVGEMSGPSLELRRGHSSTGEELNERLRYPQKIVSTKVSKNPFLNIGPPTTQGTAEAGEGCKKKKKNRKRAVGRQQLKEENDQLQAEKRKAMKEVEEDMDLMNELRNVTRTMMEDLTYLQNINREVQIPEKEQPRKKDAPKPAVPGKKSVGEMSGSSSESRRGHSGMLKKQEDSSKYVQMIVRTQVTNNHVSDSVLRTSALIAEEGGERKKKIKNRKKAADKKQLKEENDELQAEKRKALEEVEEGTVDEEDLHRLEMLMKAIQSDRNKKREEQIAKRVTEQAPMKNASKPAVSNKKAIAEMSGSSSELRGGHSGMWKKQDERPMHPHKIVRTQVWNKPVPNIVPRANPKAAEEWGEGKKKKKNRKRAAEKKQLKEQDEQPKVQMEAEKRKGTEEARKQIVEEETEMPLELLMELLASVSSEKMEELISRQEQAGMKDAPKPAVSSKKTVGETSGSSSQSRKEHSGMSKKQDENPMYLQKTVRSKVSKYRVPDIVPRANSKAAEEGGEHKKKKNRKRGAGKQQLKEENDQLQAEERKAMDEVEEEETVIPLQTLMELLSSVKNKKMEEHIPKKEQPRTKDAPKPAVPGKKSVGEMSGSSSESRRGHSGMLKKKDLSNKPVPNIIPRANPMAAEEGGESKKKKKNRKRAAGKKQLKEQDEQQKGQLQAERRKAMEAKTEDGEESVDVLIESLKEIIVYQIIEKIEGQIPEEELATMKNAPKPGEKTVGEMSGPSASRSGTLKKSVMSTEELRKVIEVMKKLHNSSQELKSEVRGMERYMHKGPHKITEVDLSKIEKVVEKWGSFRQVGLDQPQEEEQALQRTVAQFVSSVMGRKDMESSGAAAEEPEGEMVPEMAAVCARLERAVEAFQTLSKEKTSLQQSFVYLKGQLQILHEAREKNAGMVSGSAGEEQRAASSSGAASSSSEKRQ